MPQTDRNKNRNKTKAATKKSLFLHESYCTRGLNYTKTRIEILRPYNKRYKYFPVVEKKSFQYKKARPKTSISTTSGTDIRAFFLLCMLPVYCGSIGQQARNCDGRRKRGRAQPLSIIIKLTGGGDLVDLPRT